MPLLCPDLRLHSVLKTTNKLTIPSPLQKQKSYRVPNSRITLLFIAYTSPRSLAPAVSYQTLVTALNSIYHSTVFNHGDGRIFIKTVSWSYGGANIFIENHGHDRTGQLTWGMLVDTMYGVGTFLEEEACWSGEWMIEAKGLGNIGSGYIGEKVDNEVDSTLARTKVKTA